jgi:mono/diheme cytochrome c family protein
MGGRRCLTLLALSLLVGCKAQKPGKVETATVNWIKHHVTVRGKSDKNPVLDIEENRASGQDAFVSYCAVCHGKDGQNTGVGFASLMAPPVPDLTEKQVQSYSDGQLKWIVANGIYPSGMPASKEIFSDDDMWRMVLYIRHLPKKGSLGDPLTTGESH